MILPENSIGISDVLSHRECPRRFSYGMRRHVARGQQSDQRTPESGSYATEYGSAIHDCIRWVEDGYSDDDAITKAFVRYGRWLEPSDQQLLRDDLEVYRSRDFPDTRTIALEDEFRVPLFKHDGAMIFFRFKLDRLYERLDAPGTFIHVDYKSSRHAKAEADVHSDLQLWAYNWGVHEHFPECDRLLQFYDQLRYGQVPTRKSDEQREQIREWLIRQVTAVLEDEDFGDDELLAPKFNEWCPWCPILESCSVVRDLTDYAATRIAALAPAEKQGRRTVLNLDAARAGEYTDELDKVRRARQVLERFEESVRGLLRDMPADRREALGYDRRSRTNTIFTPRAAEALHEALGDRFYELVKITKSGLESNLVDDDDLLAWALGLGDKVAGADVIVPRRDAA